MDKINKKARIVKQLEATQKQRFGLRKLSVGVASVLLGTTFLFGTAGVAHADEANTSAETSETSDHQVGTAQTHVLTKTESATLAESQDATSVDEAGASNTNQTGVTSDHQTDAETPQQNTSVESRTTSSSADKGRAITQTDTVKNSNKGGEPSRCYARVYAN